MVTNSFTNFATKMVINTSVVGEKKIEIKIKTQLLQLLIHHFPAVR